MIPFYLNYLFKGPMSKYNHILRSWGLGFQHMSFGGDTIQCLSSAFQVEGTANARVLGQVCCRNSEEPLVAGAE